jgi:transcriptional regulator with XRE-family HTH domain
MPARGVALPGLRTARIRALLTQEQLAAKAKLDRNTIARLETGDRAALSTARKLADALGVDAAVLMEGTEGKAEAA